MFDPGQQSRDTESQNPKPKPLQPEEQEGSTKSRRKKKMVLVVDDERIIADTMTEILKQSGFDAVCAYDGASALELAAAVTPDFVLTDVVMPRMNGVQLAIAIRKVLPSAEIVLLSGQAGVTDILDRGRKEGFTFELIPKPIHPERLLERLKKE